MPEWYPFNWRWRQNVGDSKEIKQSPIILALFYQCFDTAFFKKNVGRGQGSWGCFPFVPDLWNCSLSKRWWSSVFDLRWPQHTARGLQRTPGTFGLRKSLAVAVRKWCNSRGTRQIKSQTWKTVPAPNQPGFWVAPTCSAVSGIIDYGFKVKFV